MEKLKDDISNFDGSLQHCNDDYLSKLCICVDESFIEKRTILEYLKSLVYSDTAKLHEKFKNRQEISFIDRRQLTLF